MNLPQVVANLQTLMKRKDNKRPTKKLKKKQPKELE